MLNNKLLYAIVNVRSSDQASNHVLIVTRIRRIISAYCNLFIILFDRGELTMAEKITEEVLKNVLLCEPITHKGRRCLSDLGLEGEVDEEYFYRNNIWVNSRFSIEEAPIKLDSDEVFQYPYSYEFLDDVELNKKRQEWEAFNTRFHSDGEGSSPIFILGVAGNGKTIAIHRRLREINKSSANIDFFSFDDSTSENLYGFSCPNKKNLNWVACHKLLGKTIGFIKDNPNLCKTIWYNYYSFILPKDTPSRPSQDFFVSIKQYGEQYHNLDNLEKTNLLREVFAKLLSNINTAPKNINDSDVLKDNLIQLLWLYCILLYCVNPNSKYYIVFDNIEEYIVVDKKKIQIPNHQLVDFIDALVDSKNRVVSLFDKLTDDSFFGDKKFKFILAMRRTSRYEMESLTDHRLHSLSHGTNYTDLTGTYYLNSIWRKKRVYILKHKMYDRFPFRDSRTNDYEGLSPEEQFNTQLVRFVDYVMYYNKAVMLGSPYQQLISPLMGFGLRRNARAQSHAVMETLAIILNNDQDNLQYKEFFQLVESPSENWGFKEARFMFRRAMMEIEFRAQISGGNRGRWKNLGIGHLVEPRRLDRRTYDVEYYDDSRVSYFRRILAFLNNQIKEDEIPAVCPPISLRELILGLLCDPKNHQLIINEDDLEQELLAIARVLIALGNMDYKQTLSAPFIILWVDDQEFHSENISEQGMVSRLKDILRESLFTEEDESSLMKRCCVRLTDAGCAFLLLWQPSFSFMASLYCFSFKPLFYLKDPQDIKFVIETVYNAADEICYKHEAEARSFCGTSFDLYRPDCMMLPIEGGSQMTYRKMVKNLHQQYLKLYRNYLKKSNRILKYSTEEYNELLTYVLDYINRYSEWDKREEEPCF